MVTVDLSRCLRLLDSPRIPTGAVLFNPSEVPVRHNTDRREWWKKPPVAFVTSKMRPPCLTVERCIFIFVYKSSALIGQHCTQIFSFVPFFQSRNVSMKTFSVLITHITEIWCKRSPNVSVKSEFWGTCCIQNFYNFLKFVHYRNIVFWLIFSKKMWFSILK